MIDTDKYEGHTEGPWVWDGTILTNHEAIHWDYGTKGVDIVDICGTMSMTQEPDLRLVADAPLLLAEVKRLREALAYTASLLTCRIEGDDIPIVDIREYALDVVDMTVDEAMGTTDLMGDEEE